MRNKRDDFLKKTKDLLAKRVGYSCSNPNCRKLTIGPNSKENHTINIGVAAHISAAAENGKRYNKKLAPDERKDYKNGIWLCQSCSKLIDSDEERYSVTVLNEWKVTAEQTALNEIENKTRKKKSLLKKIDEDDMKYDLSKIHVIKDEFKKLKSLLNNYDFVAPFPDEIFISIDRIDDFLNNSEFNSSKLKKLTNRYSANSQEFTNMLHRYTRHIPDSEMCIMKRIEPYGEIVNDDFFEVKDMMLKNRENLYYSIIELLSMEEEFKQKLKDL